MFLVFTGFIPLESLSRVLSLFDLMLLMMMDDDEKKELRRNALQPRDNTRACHEGESVRERERWVNQ